MHNVHIDRKLKLAQMFFDDSLEAILPAIQTLAKQDELKQDIYYVVSQKALDGYHYDDLDDGRVFCESCIEDAIKATQTKVEDNVTFAIDVYYKGVFNNYLLTCSTCKSIFDVPYFLNDHQIEILEKRLDKITELTPRDAIKYELLFRYLRKFSDGDRNFQWSSNVKKAELHIEYLNRLSSITQKLLKFLSVDLEK